MAPTPPKRPSSGSPTPRRSTTNGVPRPSSRQTAPEPPPEVEPAPSEEDAINNATVMDLGPEAPEAEGGAPGKSDPTLLFSNEGGARKAAGVQGKLVVLKGPKQGAEFPLGPGETSIGRNADNTIVIPDISVSRKHVVLVKEGPSWTLQDQGSGNGTLMNGGKVDQHVLKDGDTFSIGDTELQFQVIGGPPKRSVSSQGVPRRPSAVVRQSAASRASPGEAMMTPGDTTGQIALPKDAIADPAVARKRKLMLGALGGMVLVVGGLVYLKHVRDAANAQAEKATAEAQAQVQAQAADAAFNDGKRLVGEGKFSDALAKFNEAKDKGSQDAMLEEYLQRSTHEIASEKALAEGTAQLQKGQLAAALDQAGKIPDDSMLADKREDLKKQVKAAVPNRVTEARGKTAQKDFAAAHAILEDVAKIAPDDKGLADAQDDLAKAENKPPPVHLTHGPIKAVDHSAEIVQAFKDGDLKRATELAGQYAVSDESAAKLKADIESFEQAYGKMDSDDNAYKRAHELDVKIAKGHSFFSQKINAHVTSNKLKQCAQAKTLGKLGEAFSACQAVLDIDPANTEARAVISELQQKAKDMYIEGYQQTGSDPDTARKLLNQVVAMTPAADETHQKAVRKLKEMDGQ